MGILFLMASTTVASVLGPPCTTITIIGMVSLSWAASLLLLASSSPSSCFSRSWARSCRRPRGARKPSFGELLPTSEARREKTDDQRRAHRCGLRPISPDRLPIIGQCGSSQDVFLNVGHGAVGWTLAASSGYLLCAHMLKAHGFAPLGIDKEGDEFDMDAVSLKRF